MAYADFVTAMMALFLVLWLTAQDEKIKEAVERAFRQPYAIGKEGPTSMIPKEGKDVNSGSKGDGATQSASSAIELAMLRKLNEDLTRTLKSEVDDAENSTVEMKLSPEGLRISVFDRARKPVFEAKESRLTQYGQWVFSTLAWEISRYRTFLVELEGHTEHAVTPAEIENKWELSADRANAARRTLMTHGVAGTQIRKVAGFADTQPMPNYPPDAEVNRRVAVLLKVGQPGPSMTSAKSGSL